VSELHRERRTRPSWRARYLVVDPGAALAHRIEARTREMFAAGWADEVAALAASVPADAPAWNAAGYRTVREGAEGRISMDDARERVIIETRQYAKRQRTWFRHQLAGADVTPFDPSGPDQARRLEAWWGAVPA
jgi:tRNA dimethylallyltransferase